MSEKPLEQQESESWYSIILRGITKVIEIVVVSAVISLLLAVIMGSQDILTDTIEFLMFIGIIEIAAGTLAQLGNSGSGRSIGRSMTPHRILMQRMEDRVDSQLQSIEKYKNSISSRRSSIDIYLIISGFTVLILSIIFVEFISL
ncbi:MAG: hypothetical protein ACXAEU_12425 [Candidatus Hodarchaeales archaeon]|jgi:hypothetical protein